MIAGGSEASITPLAVAGFASMKALHTGEDKNRASIPFDKDRSGFVMGEVEPARPCGRNLYIGSETGGACHRI